MGFPRKRPDRLGEKLRAVREKLGLSFAEMAEALSDDEIWVYKSNIFAFEKNEREPSLLVLLRYSKLSKVKMEVFADDTKDLRW